MGAFGIWHWLVVLVIVLIVFGAKRLPEIGSGLGKGIKNFKASMDDEKDKLSTGDRKDT